MENYNDDYGNMGEITSSQDRVGRYQQKIVPNASQIGKRKSLIRKAFGVGLILGAITTAGIGVEKLVENAIKADYAKTVNPQDEPAYERRVRQLNQAEKQLLNAKTPEEINGLNSLIRDIENGVYDYNK